MNNTCELSSIRSSEHSQTHASYAPVCSGRWYMSPGSHMTNRRSRLSHTWLTGEATRVTHHLQATSKQKGWDGDLWGMKSRLFPVMNCMSWFLFLTSLWTQETLQKFMFHVLKTNFAISLNSSNLRHVGNLKNTFISSVSTQAHSTIAF